MVRQPTLGTVSGPRVTPFRRGLAVGAAVVPPAAALDRVGARVEVFDVRRDRTWLLVLLASGFPPCRQLLDDLHARGWHEPTPLVVVLDAAADHHPDAEGRVTVLRETGRAEVADALDCNVYPTAFAFDGTTVTAAPLVPHGYDALVELADRSR